APCTISIAQRRVLPTAAVLRRGVWAGTMASRNGNARVAPIPRRTVRREMCFFSINIAFPRSVDPLVVTFGCLFRPSHLKRCALYNSNDDGFESIAVLCGIAIDGPDRRHIKVLNPAAEGIHQELGCHIPDVCVRAR